MGNKTSFFSFVFYILGKQKQYETVKTKSYLLNAKILCDKWTRRSILDSDGMTKSDFPLSLWLLSESLLSTFWVILKSSCPEDILKISLRYP